LPFTFKKYAELPAANLEIGEHPNKHIQISKNTSVFVENIDLRKITS